MSRAVIVSLLSVLLLAGCVSQSPTLMPENPLDQRSAVTVGSPGLSIQAGDTLAWRRQAIWLQGEGLPDTVNKYNGRDLRLEIERQLQRRGFQFVPKRGYGADYELVAAVVLGDVEEGGELQQLLSVAPELSVSVDALDSGLIMLAMARPGSQRIIWRAVVEAYIADDTTQFEQRERLRSLVASLLSGFPAAQ